MNGTQLYSSSVLQNQSLGQSQYSLMKTPCENSFDRNVHLTLTNDKSLTFSCDPIALLPVDKSFTFMCGPIAMLAVDKSFTFICGQVLMLSDDKFMRCTYDHIIISPVVNN